ncbi:MULTISPECIES: hypothetical protein [Micromonospora]|uniref:hypothetical protein n=1 Tax=Micromonospora TaxID=1873 RepID=UPI001E3DB71B|nr:hypothetical protein [Micromonospora yangpuensis]
MPLHLELPGPVQGGGPTLGVRQGEVVGGAQLRDAVRVPQDVRDAGRVRGQVVGGDGQC